MKSILYVGATLMIGASIYGFVDYKKTSQQKEFSAMYDEDKKAAPLAEEAVVTGPVEKDMVAKKQTAVKEETTVAVKETQKTSKPVVKKAKKKKKLDHRIFSRAPLRDEEINMPELVKPAEEKIVRKDSIGEKKEQ
jgi:hypothetical protein